MDSFSIIGPVMIGPSSSHTAGAARLGGVARIVLGERPVRARIVLSGSFARTYRGHGTDRALVAGIMGMSPDDERLRGSLELASGRGLVVEFIARDIPDAHPNTALIDLDGERGAHAQVKGASIGGGSILVTEIDGFPVQIDGQSETLVVAHRDVPGIVAKVADALRRTEVNICNLSLARNERGGTAVMTVGMDGAISEKALSEIRSSPDVMQCALVPSFEA